MILFLFLFSCIDFTNNEKSKNYKPYTWSLRNDPIILNCYGKDISKSKIQSAVNFWKNYGDEISFIHMKPSKDICNKKFINGFIILKKAKRGQLSNSVLAATQKKIENKRIKSAVIFFNPGTYNIEWLTEHEFGHAFGYKHVNKKGNIMHPNIENQGGRFWIPD